MYLDGKIINLISDQYQSIRYQYSIYNNGRFEIIMYNVHYLDENKKIQLHIRIAHKYSHQIRLYLMITWKSPQQPIKLPSKSIQSFTVFIEISSIEAPRVPVVFAKYAVQ